MSDKAFFLLLIWSSKGKKEGEGPKKKKRRLDKTDNDMMVVGVRVGDVEH
jgi:hypothetical protein